MEDLNVTSQANYNNTPNVWRRNGLDLNSGKYPGRSLYWAMLKDMDYIGFCFSNLDHSSATYKEICRLKAIMDAVPFVRNCKCGSLATQFSFHKSHPLPQFWCSACNPLGSGIPSGGLSIGSSYDDASNAFTGKPRRIRVLLRKAVRELREAKGYTGNLTMKKAGEFFERNAYLLNYGSESDR